MMLNVFAFRYVPKNSYNVRISLEHVRLWCRTLFIFIDLVVNSILFYIDISCILLYIWKDTTKSILWVIYLQAHTCMHTHMKTYLAWLSSPTYITYVYIKWWSKMYSDRKGLKKELLLIYILFIKDCYVYLTWAQGHSLILVDIYIYIHTHTHKHMFEYICYWNIFCHLDLLMQK